MSSYNKYVKRITAMGVALIMTISLLINGWQANGVKAETIGTITNYNTLYSNGAGPKVNRNTAQGNDRAIRFLIDGVQAVEETGRGIYSVKVEGGSEYFYTGETITSATTTPGVYYSDGSSGSLAKGWYFVYPNGDRTKNIQVQVLESDSRQTGEIFIRKSSFSYAEHTWITEGSLKSELDTLILNNNRSVILAYVNYNGIVVNPVYPGASNGSTSFEVNNLRYYIDSVSEVRADIKIYYGSKLIDKSSSGSSFCIKIGDRLTNAPSLDYNSNAYKLNANMESKDYLAIFDWSIYKDSYGISNNVSYKHTYNAAAYNPGSGSQPDNPDSFVLIPKEGIYLPLSASKKNYLKIRSASFADNQLPVNGDYTTVYGPGGPHEITYDSLNVGQTVGVDDADLFKSKSANETKGNRILGDITSVNNNAIGSGYSDEYVTITPTGRITVKKGSGSRTYTLKTKTKYTKFIKDTNTEAVLYDSGSGASPTNYTFGYQEWTVTLTIKSIVAPTSEAEETEAATTTTTEKATTTEATKTEAPTTEAPKYKVSFGTSNYTGLSSKIKFSGGGLTGSSINVEENTSVSITGLEGDSTYYEPTVTISYGGKEETVTNGVFTMPATNVTVNVTYKVKATSNITYSFPDRQGATATGPATALEGTTVSFAVPGSNDQYKDPVVSATYGDDNLPISSLKPGTTNSNGTINYSFTMPNGNVNVKISYTENEFQISANYADTYTTYSANDLILSKTTGKKGEVITVTIPAANTRYNTPSVTASSATGSITVSKTSDVSYNFTMPAGNVTVIVTYQKISYKVTTSSNNTQAAINVTSPAYPDAKVTFSCSTGDTVYKNPVVTVKSGSTPIACTYSNGSGSFTMPDSNVTIEVTYEVWHDVTVTTNGLTVSLDKTNAKTGDKVTATMQINDTDFLYTNPKLTATGVTLGNPSDSGNVRKYQFTMPDKAVSLSATYETAMSQKVTVSNITGEFTARQALSSLSPSGNITVTYSGGATRTRELNSSYFTDKDEVTATTEDANKNTIKTHTVTVTVTAPAIGSTCTAATGTFTYTYKETIAPNERKVALSVGESMTGSVTLSKSTAIKGDTITVNAKASAKYAFPTITVDQKVGTLSPTYDSLGNATATFKMPDADVTVTVKYTAITLAITSSKVTSGGTYDAGTKAMTADELKALCTATAKYGSKTVSVAASYISAAIGKETTTNDNGTIKHSFPVTVTANYGEVASEYKFTYVYGTPASYNIVATSVMSGVKIEPANAYFGDTVTVTVTPVADTPEYIYNNVTWTYGNGTALAVDSAGTNKYTFKMPAGNVTASVNYSKIKSIVINKPTTIKESYDKKVSDPNSTFAAPTATVTYANSKVKTINLTKDQYEYVEDTNNIKVTKGLLNSATGKYECEAEVPIILKLKDGYKYGGLMAAEVKFAYKYRYPEGQYAVNLSGASILKTDTDPVAEKIDDKELASLVDLGRDPIDGKVKYDPGEKVTVKALSNALYAYATIKSSEVTDITTTYGEDGTATFAFTMPNKEISLAITYAPLMKVYVSKGITTTEYDKMMDVKGASLDGGEFTLDFGGKNKIVKSMWNKESNEINGMLSVASGEAKLKETKDGKDIYEVPVNVTYNATIKDKKYSVKVLNSESGAAGEATLTYTYAVDKDFTITKTASVKEVQESAGYVVKAGGKNGEKIRVTVPADTDTYIEPIVTITVNGKTEKLTLTDGYYEFTLTGDTTVNADYAVLSAIEITDVSTLGGASDKRINVADFNAGKVKATAVYKRSDNTEIKKELSLNNTNTSFAETSAPKVKEEKEETNVYEVGITVTVTVGDKTATKDFTYTYEESKAATDVEAVEEEQAKAEVVDSDVKSDASADAAFAKPKMLTKKCKSKKKKITIKWSAVEGATYYAVLISKKKNGFYERNKIVPASKTSYTVTKFNGKKLKKGTKYFIKIQPISNLQEARVETSEVIQKAAKKKGKFTVTASANGNQAVRNITVYMSLTGGEDAGEWKKVASYGNTGRSYSKTLKKFNGKKIKKGRTYYIRYQYTLTDADFGDASSISAPIRIKCKK